MKRFAWLFVCFLVINAYCQEVPAVGFNKFQLGVNFSSDVCYRTLVNNNGKSIVDEIIDWRNENEIPKFGYTSGFNFGYNLNKTIGFETGIQISNKGYQTKTKDLIYEDQIDPITGVISPESSDTKAPTKVKYIYSDYYLEVPIKANFSFGNRKVRFITSAGIAVNFFIAETETAVYTYIDGSTKRISNPSYFSYNIINLSPMVSLGIDWKITPKINLKAEPTVRYGIIKITDAPITGHLWNCGLNVGCYYSF
jgi:hypothetical protein